MAIVFKDEVVATFSPEEKAMFDNLVARGKAQVHSEKVDVQAIIARRNAIAKADDEARKQLEAGFL